MRRALAALVVVVVGAALSAGGCSELIGATGAQLSRCDDGIIGNQLEGDCGGTDGVIDVLFVPDCPPCKTGQRCFEDADCLHGACTAFVCEGCNGKQCSGDPCATSADCGEGACNLGGGVCSTTLFCGGGCGSGCAPAVTCAPGDDCLFAEDCGAGTACDTCEAGTPDCPCASGRCCLFT